MSAVTDSEFPEGETFKEEQPTENEAVKLSPPPEEPQQDDIPTEEAPKESTPPVELDPESDDPMKMPPHGTEVYIGGITKSATDAQIREFCEQKGEVFRLKCPRDPSLPGQNRGYAFVTYTTRDAAHSAVDTLNQSEMKDFPDKKVSLVLSQVKNRLFVGNIPRDSNREELKSVFEKEVKGVVEVEVMMEHDQLHNRGFCFLECYNHHAADMARRILSRPDFKHPSSLLPHPLMVHSRVRDRGVTVAWAEPRRTDADHEKVKSVYVGNLSENVTENQLKDLFKAYGDIEKVVLLPSRMGRSQRDYGFVHYVDRACALKAVEAAENSPLYLDDRQLSVSVARPTVHRDDGWEGGARRPYSSRDRSYSSDYRDPYNSGYPYRYPEPDYNAASYPPAAYGMNNMALVPTYLPNGQLGFVFQQTPMPGSGGPMPMGRSTRPYGRDARYKPY